MAERRHRLSDRRIKEIRSLAWHCLSQIGCVAAPVPVEQVASKLGATVRRSPFTSENFAGMLVFNANRYVIAVNSSNHENRQRFTIAHECGHLLLGHQLSAHVDASFSISRDEKSSQGTDSQEVEANQFAAELLMPLRFLLRDLREIEFERDEDVRQLAERYGVSTTAMSFRIANVFL